LNNQAARVVNKELEKTIEPLMQEVDRLNNVLSQKEQELVQLQTSNCPESDAVLMEFGEMGERFGWSGWSLNNSQFVIRSYLFFNFLVEATNILPMVFASSKSDSNLRFSTKSDSINISNQYSVSLASLSAISNLCKKSLSDCADWASLTLAPIEVPERSNCFDRVLRTPGCSSKKLQAFMILTAKFLVISVILILAIMTFTSLSDNIYFTLFSIGNL